MNLRARSLALGHDDHPYIIIIKVMIFIDIYDNEFFLFHS